MRTPRLIVSALLPFIGAAVCLADQDSPAIESCHDYDSGPKVIIDTDSNTMGDDGQVAVLAAQLYARGAIDLLGFTVVSGNQWRDQGVSDCLKNVERLGIGSKVGVYVGANDPLLHDYKTFLLEQLLFVGKDYLGAYYTPAPGPGDLKPAPDGFATHTKPQKKGAVRFLIDSFHKYPHQVSLLAIGPCTNVALAMREDPTIIPLIKQIVLMGGQMYAPGNAFNDAGEFNWWFDPESVQVVLRADVKRTIVPLDVTNTVTLPQSVRDAIVNHHPVNAVTKIYATDGPHVGDYIYDTVAFSCFFRPGLITNSFNLYVDMPTTFNATYGKTAVFASNPFPSVPTLSTSKVVFRVDNDEFFRLYTDLFLRPVPVVFSHRSGERD